MSRKTNTTAQTPLLDIGRQGRTGICVPAIDREVTSASKERRRLEAQAIENAKHMLN